MSEALLRSRDIDRKANMVRLLVVAVWATVFVLLAVASHAPN